MRRLRRHGILLLLALPPLSTGGLSLAQAAPEPVIDHVLVQTSLYTQHFDSDPEHIDQQDMLGIELHDPQRWMAGAAWLKNSFDQPIWFFYVGREFPLWRLTPSVEVRAKLAGGLLRGYDGDKQDNIPLNDLGIAPAVLPSLGARWGRFESDLLLFGAAGVMLIGGVRF